MADELQGKCLTVAPNVTTVDNSGTSHNKTLETLKIFQTQLNLDQLGFCAWKPTEERNKGTHLLSI